MVVSDSDLALNASMIAAGFMGHGYINTEHIAKTSVEVALAILAEIKRLDAAKPTDAQA